MTVSVETLARELLGLAAASGQVAHRLAPDVDALALRDAVRRAARAEGIRIRTAMLEPDVLAVVRADADIWSDSTSVMRAKLTPPE